MFLFSLILGGLASGSLYAMVGVAIVLVLQASDIPNFAQGEMAMFSTFVGYWILQRYGIDWWWAVALSLVFAALLGVIVQQLVIRPLLGQPTINAVIATLGLNIVLHSLAGMIWGNETHIFPSPLSEVPPLTVAGVTVPMMNAAIILVGVFMILGLTFIVRKTRPGIALRAASQNQPVAKLMGISISRSFAVAWGLGGLVGGVAGVLVAPVLFLDTNMMGLLLIKGFAGGVLGGLDNLIGVFVGGLCIGVIENLMGAYISGSFGEALVFLVIIGVLIVAPEGVFGRVRARKV
jgi:branched-chain amino acid transport system permease protein